MNAFLVWLGRWFAQPDKAAHGILEALFGFVACFALESAGVPLLVAVLVVLWAGALVAWAKERYDKAHPGAHTYDGWDAYAGTAGCLVGVTLAVVLLLWGVGLVHQVHQVASIPLVI